ncbi:16S rRNA (guanine(527)-N(7))-methyltransferase RsmG [Primorskyibacter flagellatus]|uniref:16S rRNA (guanine(527)-N(7))-methyltransferase RsmG n=1 Tax=Primorskyibacter flagellatus TaxID=1387277 RepID=UPI003A8EDB52
MRSLNVSRETYEKLQRYVDLLLAWTAKINLISKKSASDVWRRHIIDSIQVFQSIEHPSKTWLDLGSGGGLPGLVVAILATEASPEMKTVLVESDLRKAAFLRNAIRELDLHAIVMSERIENLDPLKANIVSARALADLETLLSFANLHLAYDGTAIFSKGEKWQKEVDKARESWRFDLDVIQSKTDPMAAILKIGGISRV